MPRKFQKYLDGYNIYCCNRCGAHWAKLSDLISTSYVGATGKAYLMNQMYFIFLTRPQDQCIQACLNNRTNE